MSKLGALFAIIGDPWGSCAVPQAARDLRAAHRVRLQHPRHRRRGLETPAQDRRARVLRGKHSGAYDCGAEVRIEASRTQRNNRLVWDETIRILEDLFHNVWEDKDVVEVDHVLDITVGVSWP